MKGEVYTDEAGNIEKKKMCEKAQVFLFKYWKENNIFKDIEK